jgi:hypothetical protein
MLLTELAGITAHCRRFAESDCSDTEAFRAVVRQAEDLSVRIPAACGPLGDLVYWVLVVFKTRPAELHRLGVQAMADALDGVESIWLPPEALDRIRDQLREAGVNLRPF